MEETLVCSQEQQAAILQQRKCELELSPPSAVFLILKVTLAQIKK